MSPRGTIYCYIDVAATAGKVAMTANVITESSFLIFSSFQVFIVSAEIVAFT